MLRQIEIFVILILVSLSMGCFNQKFVSISDCEGIENDFKRDRCFAGFVEAIPLNNTSLRIKLCEKIINLEIKDLCSFKVARDGWRTMSSDTLINLCESISNDHLEESCRDIYVRDHLQMMR